MAITKINTPELFDLGTTNTALRLPSGDTASRPSNPNTGEWRYNTDDNYVEYWDGTAWFQIDYETVAPTCTTNTINYPTAVTAYYKMEDATDQTGNYNGTPTNVNFNVAGKFGNAGEFNGSSSYINLGTGLSGLSGILNQKVSQSVSFWMNTSFTGISGNSAIYSVYYGDGISLTVYYLTDGTLTFFTRYSGNVTSFNTTQTFNDSQWHHIAVSIDIPNLERKVYIDNTLESTQSLSSAAYGGSGADIGVALGTVGNFNTQYYKGKLDQVRIFPSALTSDQVTQLYNEVQCAPTIVPSEHFNVNTYIGNGSTQTIDAKFNEAAVFNGSSSYVTFPDLDTFFGEKRTCSVSVWFKAGAQSNDGFIFIDYSGNLNIEIKLKTNGTISIGTYYGTLPARTDATSGTYADNNWHHIVVANDIATNTRKTYIDDVEVLSNPLPSGTFSGFTNFFIGLGVLGAPNPLSGTYFNGSIDQVRIYDTALTQQQVTELYTNETTATAQLLDFPVGAGCIAAYELDGNADDISGLYSGTPTDIGYTGMQFAPDLVWAKCRSTSDPSALVDSVRGANWTLFSDNTNEERNRTSITSFNTNGFTLGDYTNTNRLNDTYVAWCWKAADTTTTIAAGTVGNTIASDVRANTDAGFSIVKYTGNETSGATIGHGLSSAPELIIVKELDNTNNWQVYSSPTGATKFLYLNSTIEALTATNRWNDTSPSATVFTIGNSLGVNRNNSDFIAYCFASIPGFSDIGSYVGTGVAGNTIVTGFRPAFLMTKRTDTAGTDWHILDNKRNPSNPADDFLFPNEPYAETNYSANPHNFLSNGFSVDTTNGAFNASGGTYIFLAIAEEVFVPDNFFNDDSTVATYKLDGDAGDSSGNGYNGVATNVTYSTGEFDDAAVFNGSSSKIVLPTSTFSPSTFTISAWCNVSSDTDENTILELFDNQTYPNHTTIVLSAGNNGARSVRFLLRNYTTNQYNYEPSGSVTKNVWKHYAMTYDGSTVKSYIDGSLVDSGSLTLSNTVGTISSIQLGLSSGTRYLNGSIDQVRIFDRALDSGEVAQLANE